MKDFTNKKALITGGASGIGKLMGKMLLQKGLHTLVIWDINNTLLQSTVEEFTALGYKAQPYCIDVMNTQSMIDGAEQVKKDIGNIDLLINNAGIIVGKYFTDHTHEDIDRSMIINGSAGMHLCKLFLPGMVQQKNGHIVNIASAAGMVSNPKMSVYAASKWAVIGWSDSLRLEMEALGTGVKVSTVTPYYINTGMFAGVHSSLIPILEPEVAAKRIIRGIEKNRIFIRMPGIVYVLQLVKGILPARWFDVVVGKWMGVYDTMKEFKGRV